MLFARHQLQTTRSMSFIHRFGKVDRELELAFLAQDFCLIRRVRQAKSCALGAGEADVERVITKCSTAVLEKLSNRPSPNEVEQIEGGEEPRSRKREVSKTLPPASRRKELLEGDRCDYYNHRCYGRGR